MRTLIGTLTLCAMALPAQAQYGGGTGDPNDPYLIYTAKQMNEIGAHPEHWGDHFRLMADIDLGDYAPNKFNLIGTHDPFTGVFDGNRHSISNFHLRETDACPLWRGLFCMVADPNARIMNLELIDPNLTGQAHIGPVVGWLEEGTVTNCHVTGGNVSGRYPRTPTDAGGLVGFGGNGIITHCTSSAQVTGESGVGGLVGKCFGCVIESCRATGDVTGDMDVGGLVGSTHASIASSCATGKVLGNWEVGGLAGSCVGPVTNCYATGSVTSEWWSGGLIGRLWTGASVTNCYATGKITDWPDEYDTAPSTPGGLLNRGADELSGCFWDVQTSERTVSAGGTGLTTAAMQRAQTFLEAGWDFIGEAENGTEDIWWIDEGVDYPRLWWELEESDPEATP